MERLSSSREQQRAAESSREQQQGGGGQSIGGIQRRPETGVARSAVEGGEEPTADWKGFYPPKSLGMPRWDPVRDRTSPSRP